MSNEPDPNVHLPPPTTKPSEPNYELQFNVWNDDIAKKEGWFNQVTHGILTSVTHPLRFWSNLFTMKSDEQANEKVKMQMLKDGTYPPQVERYKKMLLNPWSAKRNDLFIWNQKLFRALYGDELTDSFMKINNAYNKLRHDDEDEDLSEAYKAMEDFLSETIELPTNSDQRLLVNSYIIPQQYYKRFKQEYGIPTVEGENTDTGNWA